MALRGGDNLPEKFGLFLQAPNAGVRMAAIGATNDKVLFQQALRDKAPPCAARHKSA